MIKYPKINNSARKVAIVLASWYNLGKVMLDYSEFVKLYCEIIPEDKKYLTVKLRMTVEDKLSIYEDINGGLEHRDFVRDIAKYLESKEELDLGEVRVERWDRKEREYKLNDQFQEKSCFNCQYRSKRGYCNLLKSCHPKKKDNLACKAWTKREDANMELENLIRNSGG